MRHAGLVYRGLNPRWAREPLSGEGARLHGGRFNARGVPALYAALSVLTAVRESNQIGTLQPTVLVAYEADVAAVFDGTDAVALAAQGVTPAILAADDWRVAMRGGGVAPSQAFADRLIGQGYAGLLVPSYARGAGPSDRNLVLWRWGEALPARLRVVDDEGRLARDPAPPPG